MRIFLNGGLKVDKSECKNILALIQTAYPRFYVNSTRQDLINAINLWHEMFKENKFDDVIDAVKSLIAEKLFPPTISEIKQKIAAVQNLIIFF